MKRKYHLQHNVVRKHFSLDLDLVPKMLLTLALSSTSGRVVQIILRCGETLRIFVRSKQG